MRSCRFGVAAAAFMALAVVAGACTSDTNAADAEASERLPGGDSSTTTDAPTTTAAPAATCTPSGAAGELQQRDLSTDTEDRWYLLSAPESESAELPLVIDFHGLAEGAETHSNMSQFSALATSENFLVAFPNGTREPVSWRVGPDTVGADVDLDLAFVAALIDDVAADHCVDRSRIYATGLSNGAMMSSYLACARSDVFAAVAPIAGVTAFTDCEGSRAVPMMGIHGTADPILLFNGGVGDIAGALDGGTVDGVADASDLDGPGYPAAAAAWAQRNGCEPDYTDTEVTDTVIHRVWTCPDDADVEFYIVMGGGHSWPGSDFSAAIESVVGPTTFDIDATQLAWDFVSRFSLSDPE